MLLAMLASPVFGQADPFAAAPKSGPSIYDDQQKFVRNADAPGSLDASMFGDRISLYNGALEFVQTDVDLKGNNDLPVRIGRRRVIDGGGGSYEDAGFGGWDYDIPHLRINRASCGRCLA